MFLFLLLMVNFIFFTCNKRTAQLKNVVLPEGVCSMTLILLRLGSNSSTWSSLYLSVQTKTRQTLICYSFWTGAIYFLAAGFLLFYFKNYESMEYLLSEIKKNNNPL